MSVPCIELGKKQACVVCIYVCVCVCVCVDWLYSRITSFSDWLSEKYLVFSVCTIPMTNVIINFNLSFLDMHHRLAHKNATRRADKALN